MNRDHAFEELKLRLSDKYILFRSIAVEAIMEELARYFHSDVKVWGLAGLLHDIDYEKTLERPELHGITGAEILENMDIDEAIVYSVRAHNETNNIPRKRKMDKALFLADYVGEAILAEHIENHIKLSDISVENVTKRLKEKGIIKDKFSEIGLVHEEFVGMSLKAVSKLTDQPLIK